MLLTKRKTQQGAEPPDPPPARGEERDPAEAWVKGQQLRSRVATGGLWALLLCGPVGLGMGYLALESAANAEAPAPVAVQDAGDTVSVGAFAEKYVSAYLTTPLGEEETLAQYAPDVEPVLASTPLAVGSVTAVDVSETGDGRWRATVAAEQEPAAATPEGATSPPADPQPLYLSVAIHAEEGAIAATSLPAIVTGPATATTTEPTQSRIEDPAVRSATEAFLAAYLLQEGPLEALTAPGAEIAAVETSPFTAVSLQEIRSAEELPDAPQEGGTLLVTVTAQASTDDTTTLGLEYDLLLKLREGRWEVAALNPIESERNPS